MDLVHRAQATVLMRPLRVPSEIDNNPSDPPSVNDGEVLQCEDTLLSAMATVTLPADIVETTFQRRLAEYHNAAVQTTIPVATLTRSLDLPNGWSSSRSRTNEAAGTSENAQACGSTTTYALTYANS